MRPSSLNCFWPAHLAFRDGEDICSWSIPRGSRVLAHAPTARMTRMNSGVVVELFEGGWLELGEDLSPVRVIVARHPAPPPGKDIPVGKRVGEWVYELFITTLDAEGFLVEDVLDLSYGRGAGASVLADEDVEEDPDRWCSYSECGQELWQIACQWVWNLRLCLGQTMQGVQVRQLEWAPAKEAPAVYVAEEPSPQEYGPWQWAAAFGRATGRFGAEDFVLQEDGKLRCPAGASLWLSEVRQENAFTQRAVYLAYQTDCQPCSLREQCLAKGGQRGSSPSCECGPSSLASTRTYAGFAQAGPARTDAVGGCGWASPSPHLDDPLAQAIRRDPSACRHAAVPFPSPSPTTCGAVASPLERA